MAKKQNENINGVVENNSQSPDLFKFFKSQMSSSKGQATRAKKEAAAAKQETKEALEKAENAIRGLEVQRARYESSVRRHLNTRAELQALEVKKREVEKELKNAQRSIKKLEKENTSLTEENKVYIDKFNELLGIAKEQSDAITELSGDVKALNSENNQLTQSVEALNVENGQLTQSLETSQTEVKKLKKREKATRVVAGVGAGVALAGVTGSAYLGVRLGKALDEKAKLEAQNGAYVVTVGEQEETINDLIKYYKTLSNNVGTIIDKYNVKENDVIKGQTEEEKLAGKFSLDGGKTYINLSQKGIEALADGKNDQITSDYFRTTVDQLRFIDGYSNGYLPTKVNTLIARVNELTDIINNSQLGNNDALVQELKGQIAELNAENETLNESYKISKANEETLKAQVGSLTTELSTVNDKLNSTTKAMNELEQKCSDLEKQLEEAKNDDEVNRLKAKLAETETALDEKSKQYEDLDTKFKAIEQDLDSTKEALTVAQNTSKDLENKLSSANQQIKVLNNKIASANQQIAEKDQIIDEKDAENARLEDKIQYLEDKADGNNKKPETPWNGKTDQSGSNTPVADEDNPEGYSPNTGSDEDHYDWDAGIEFEG